MEGLFRHNPYTAFPPAVPGLPPGLPPAVSFGSLQGAFQPKSTNPELPPRLGPVPSGLPQKGTQIPDHFRPPLRKPGKWCAMHVRVAYMILRHQEKMKGDSHKLDFRNDLLPCLPGPYGALPPGQELSHPAASLFTATGAVHAAANPFTAAPGAHGPFLSPSTHIDPFGRPTSFASLAALSNGAFGGLGSPGRAGRGQAGTQGLSQGIWSQQETEQQGKGPGYLGWKEGQMLPAWLTAQVPPPTCSCYLCVPPSPKGSISKLQTPPLSGSVPLLHFQVPPGLLGPALQNPVPQNPALGRGGGQRRSPRTTHQRRGSARGWATQAASSAASRRQSQPSQSSRRPQAGAQPRRQGSV
uniref:Fibrosin n=1 Tax=Ursus maritimus TaxID=29073 RepID=A0A452UBN9_URSMA